jgi:hypothetical protein
MAVISVLLLQYYIKITLFYLAFTRSTLGQNLIYISSLLYLLSVVSAIPAVTSIV